MIEISSGTLKGRRFSFTPAKDLRPTSARVRSAFFNMLSSINVNSQGLDLFAGTAFVGLEALSRGAKKVFFNEKNRSRFCELKKLFKQMQVEEQVELYCNDAIEMIDILFHKKIYFDWIYIDPPYGDEVLIKTIERVYDKSILNSGGLLVLETQKTDKIKLPKCFLENYFLWKEKDYGGSRLTIYRYK